MIFIFRPVVNSLESRPMSTNTFSCFDFLIYIRFQSMQNFIFNAQCTCIHCNLNSDKHDVFPSRFFHHCHRYWRPKIVVWNVFWIFVMQIEVQVSACPRKWMSERSTQNYLTIYVMLLQKKLKHSILTTHFLLNAVYILLLTERKNSNPNP